MKEKSKYTQVFGKKLTYIHPSDIKVYEYV
jgi:hypothetical protein